MGSFGPVSGTDHQTIEETPMSNLSHRAGLALALTTALAAPAIAANAPALSPVPATASNLPALESGPARPLGSATPGARPKNIILFISDGASWGTWDMASYWQYGAKGMQPYDSFSVKLGMTTYPLNTSSTPTFTGTPTIGYNPVKAWDVTPTGDSDHFAGYKYIKADYPDSAAAGTAIASGIKTYNNSINFDDFANAVPFITQDLKAAGFATGAITSVPFSHATPAVFGAQNISRNNYHQITQQMMTGGALDLVMGGGHPWFNDSGLARATPGTNWMTLAQYDALKNGSAGWNFIETKADFEALANGALTFSGPLWGIAEVGATLQANRNAGVLGADPANPSGVRFIDTVPTLVTMTKGAINHLSTSSDKGFFLMVEGGAVDWMAHGNNTGRIIEEQVDFNLAVAAAVNWVNTMSSWDETLMIVLTDHGNGMPMGPDSDTIAFQPIENRGAGVLPGVRWHYGTHTNENTLFWAHGAGAELFFNYVVGIDPGLADGFEGGFAGLGFNDGRYIDNVSVPRAIFDAIRGPQAAIPEPATWAMLIAGFGIVGCGLRRRRALTPVAG
jgi:alkaline phosphatase